MSLRHNLITAAAIFGLVALTFLLNLNALSGNWRFDDGWLLDYASRFSPLDYFFNPAITRGYSLNNLTPSNPLIFDINLWLFGLSPKGFYFQHLATLAGCALGSYFLLRIWATPLIAFLGSALFLAGVPSLFVAQQLMVGHYVAGLFFTILAVAAYRLNLDRKQWLLTALSTLFYILATTCKEVYFPLPFVLIFFQHERLTTRIYQALPMFAWSIGYMFWRLAVLGSFVGGYDAGGRSFSLSDALLDYSAIPDLLFAGPYLPWAAIFIFVVLLASLAKSKQLNVTLLVVALLAVLLPLLPLTQVPGITQANRYLLLPWWLFAMTLAATLARLPRLNIGLKTLIATIFILLAGTQALQVQKQLTPKLAQFDAVYEFFLESPSSQTFYSAEIKDAYYLDTVLNGARYAQARIKGDEAKKLGILVSARSLATVDTTEKNLWSYDQACQCMRNISHEVTPKKASKLKPPKLTILPISPPYPPLFQAGEGSLRVDKTSDMRVRLSGISRHPPGDQEHQLILITPQHPKAFKVTLDGAHKKNSKRFKFHVTLDYRSSESADSAAEKSCLLIRSAHTPLRLLVSDNNTNCQDLLSTQP
ncbi:MAG: hypothetical protein ABW104_19000 [Candidatus Thiodiazotropha sp. 6PLUC2]